MTKILMAERDGIGPDARVDWMDPELPEPTYSVADMAVWLGLSAYWVRALCREHGQGHRVGGAYKFTIDEAMALKVHIATHKRGPKPREARTFVTNGEAREKLVSTMLKVPLEESRAEAKRMLEDVEEVDISEIY